MPIYLTHGHQETEKLWYGTSASTLELDERVMSGHNYWDICPVVCKQKVLFMSGPDHIVLI